MLEKVDLKAEVSKKEYKQRIPLLRRQLYDLQQASWQNEVPVIIVFEGWDAAGKGSSIQYLTRRLDPRGFKLHAIRPVRTFETLYPWLWRYWQRIPARGEWGIFDRSWYGRVLVERMEKLIPAKAWKSAYPDITTFERLLADDGTLFVKFFIHISKKEQKERFETLSADPLTAWQVEEEDWQHHKNYRKWERVYEEMFERTDTEWAPWTIIEATDFRHSRIKVFEVMIAALQARLKQSPDAVGEAASAAEGAN